VILSDMRGYLDEGGDVFVYAKWHMGRQASLPNIRGQHIIGKRKGVSSNL